MKKCQLLKCQIHSGNSDVYVYALIDPKIKNVRYVGKTINLERRFKRHLRDARCGLPGHRNSWIRQLLSAGCTPRLVVLEKTADNNWQAAERRCIRRLKKLGAPLTNMDDGGIGGHAVLQEVRNKMSRAHKRRSRRLRRKYGFAASPETRAKLSRNALGHSWNRGWHHTEITKKILSKLAVKRENKLSKIKRGKTFITESGRQSLSASRKAASPLVGLTEQTWKTASTREIATLFGMKYSAVNAYRWRNRKPKTDHEKRTNSSFVAA